MPIFRLFISETRNELLVHTPYVPHSLVWVGIHGFRSTQPTIMSQRSPGGSAQRE